MEGMSWDIDLVKPSQILTPSSHQTGYFFYMTQFYTPPHPTPSCFHPPPALWYTEKGTIALTSAFISFVFQTLAPVRLRAEAMRSHFGDVEVMRNKLDLKDEEIKEIKRLIKIKVRLHDYVRVFREIHQY